MNAISFGRLDGRVAVVLGASGGIGRAVCGALLDAGAKVMMIGRDADRLAALASELGAGAHIAWVPADVTSQLEVDDARGAAPRSSGSGASTSSSSRPASSAGRLSKTASPPTGRR